MVEVMCGQKVVDRKMTEEQMDYNWGEENYRLVSNSEWIRWYRHMLRRDDDSVLRVALDLEVSGKRK